MEKKIRNVLICVALVLILIVLVSSFYTVNPKEYAAVRQFGKIVKIVDTPGLKDRKSVV